MFDSNGVSSKAVRPHGVKIPDGQLAAGNAPTQPAPPQTVLNFTRAETYAVRYSDDNGQSRTELVHFIDGTWYRAPNGENYAAQLRPLRGDVWLAKQLTSARADKTTPVAVPEVDNVSFTTDDLGLFEAKK